MTTADDPLPAKPMTAATKKKDGITKPKLPARLDNPIPIGKLIELRQKNLPYTEIAKIIGCSKQNVWERLQPFVASIDNLQSVKNNRADTLAVVSDTILSSLTQADIKAASAYQRVGMFGILYDKERSERGEKTGQVPQITIVLGGQPQVTSKPATAISYHSTAGENDDL